jgi:Mg/Co/Ni transporter MgtE
MAKPDQQAAWAVVARALLRGVLIGAVLAAVFAAGVAVVASHAPAKAAKVVV